MKYLQLILWGLGCLFLAIEAVDVSDEKLLSAGSDGGDIFEANEKFKCPKSFGNFPDPTDCAHYYACFAKFGVRRKCPAFHKFHPKRRMCLPSWMVKCGDGDGDGDITSTIIVTEPIVTEVPDMNTADTSEASIGTEEVATEEVIVTEEVTNEEVSATEEVTNEEVTATEEVTNEEVTATEEVTNEEVTATEEVTNEEVTATEEVITGDSSTTKFRPTGPPDHTCDEDDVDCIVTETGDVTNWFICPREVGAFPHPSSDRLFIFCLNWIPVVKRCGMDLVYSEERRMCIEKTYFV